MKKAIPVGKITPEHFKIRLGMYKSCILNISEEFLKVKEYKYKDLEECMNEINKENENNILVQTEYKSLTRRISALTKLGYKVILISKTNEIKENDIVNFVIRKAV